MGFIYKITNQVNNKIYIGQTVKSVQKRFTQHKNNSNKEYFSQIVLYKAFNKYGFENFKCETIEEVPNDKLDEREKYWIEYYDSYFNGYNSTLGGRATQLYNWDIEDIIEKYYALKSARAVAKELGCDHSTIDRILNENGVKRFSSIEQLSKPIYLYKNGEEYYFDNTELAAQWLIDNGLVRSKSNKCVRGYLTSNCLHNKPYYGYELSRESKRQSAPLVIME